MEIAGGLDGGGLVTACVCGDATEERLRGSGELNVGDREIS